MDIRSVPEIARFWGVAVAGSVEELATGTVYRFSTESGDDLVLKQIGSTNADTLQRMDFEVEVLTHLYEHGVPVAVPLSDRAGRIGVPWEGHIYRLSPCLQSSDGGVTGQDRERLFMNYGRAIAEMHLALAAFPPEKSAGRVGRTALVYDVFDIGLPVIAAYLSGKPEIAFRAMLTDLEPDMRDALQGLPEQLIHRDCHAENLLSSGTEVTGIVDWDHLIVGPRILDIAYFAVQQVKHDVRDALKTARWFHDLPYLVRGYADVTSLLLQETAALPYAMIAVPIFFAHWAISEAMDVDYIQQELDAAGWLYRNLDMIRKGVCQ